MDAGTEPLAPGGEHEPSGAQSAGLPDEGAVAFARTPPRQKAALLRACLPRLLAAAPEMVAGACARLGLPPTHPLAGGAWLAGPVALIANVRRFAEALEQVASQGRPALPARELRGRFDGRTVAHLRPRSFAERALFRDAKAFAVFDAAVAPEDVIAGQALSHRSREPEGRSVTAIEPLGALRALFVEGARVTLGGADPAVAQALAPLCDAGWLTLGAGEAARPRTHTTVVVVPVLYARDEIAFIARRIAGEVAAGAAFALPAPHRVLVSGCWAQRAMFVEALRQAFAALPAEVPRRTLVDGAVDPAGPVEDDQVTIVDAGCDDPAAMLAAASTHPDVMSAPMLEIILHEVLEEEPHIARALEQAIVATRARVVGVNEWPPMLELRGDAPWGPWMLTRVDKGVVYGPQWPRRAPEYMPDPGAPLLGRRLAAFHARPSLVRVPRIVPRLS